MSLDKDMKLVLHVLRKEINFTQHGRIKYMIAISPDLDLTFFSFSIHLVMATAEDPCLSLSALMASLTSCRVGMLVSDISTEER